MTPLIPALPSPAPPSVTISVVAALLQSIVGLERGVGLRARPAADREGSALSRRPPTCWLLGSVSCSSLLRRFRLVGSKPATSWSGAHSLKSRTRGGVRGIYAGGSGKTGYTRRRYSPVRVSISILSPVDTNSGTGTSNPLPTLAGFITLPDVSPLTAGSV